MKEARLDKTKFKINSFKEADNTVAFWRSRPWYERLQAGYHLSLRAYGYDPEDEPRLDKSKFSMRKSK